MQRPLRPSRARPVSTGGVRWPAPSAPIAPKPAGAPGRSRPPSRARPQRSRPRGPRARDRPPVPRPVSRDSRLDPASPRRSAARSGRCTSPTTCGRCRGSSSTGRSGARPSRRIVTTIVYIYASQGRTADTPQDMMWVGVEPRVPDVRVPAARPGRLGVHRRLRREARLVADRPDPRRALGRLLRDRPPVGLRRPSPRRAPASTSRRSPSRASSSRRSAPRCSPRPRPGIAGSSTWRTRTGASARPSRPSRSRAAATSSGTASATDRRDGSGLAQPPHAGLPDLPHAGG